MGVSPMSIRSTQGQDGVPKLERMRLGARARGTHGRDGRATHGRDAHATEVRQELAAAQHSLRQLMTLRQEAVLVLNGLLD
jgi:hypothetical protein